MNIDEIFKDLIDYMDAPYSGILDMLSRIALILTFFIFLCAALVFLTWAFVVHNLIAFILLGFVCGWAIHRFFKYHKGKSNANTD